MLLGNLGASLLGNLLTNKGTIRAGECTIRVGQDLELNIFKKNKKFVGNKNIITNTYRIQACDSIMC